MPDMVGAVIPVEGSDKLLVLIGTKICLVDRETGVWQGLSVLHGCAVPLFFVHVVMFWR